MDQVSLNPVDIDWTSRNSDLYLNPKMALSAQQDYLNLAEQVISSQRMSSSLVLASSGTTSDPKDLILKFISKNSFLAAAKNFNLFFEIGRDDRWLRTLPRFHVGGLAILARSFLQGQNNLFEWPDLFWKPAKLIEDITRFRITRLSLVPTQVYDLVLMEAKAPPSLKTVFVGGAGLDQDLYSRARQLGWPLLPSYGMTETSSMIMSASLKSLSSHAWPDLELLPSVQVRLDIEGRLSLQAPGLLSCESRLSKEGLEVKSWSEGDWFQTQDYFQPNQDKYQFKARQQDLVKISGELVNLNRLRGLFDACLNRVKAPTSEVFLHHRVSLRKGSELVLYVTGLTPLPTLQRVIDQFNQSVLPFERIVDVVQIDEIPRTSLGKVRISELK
jgi:O-succinylbenzoic acid--CoA ligase